MVTRVTYQWIVIFNPGNAVDRAAFGPFSSFEEAGNFPTPPGVSDDASKTVTRLNEPVYYEEQQ